MLLERQEGDDLQRRLVGGGQHHIRCGTVVVGTQPVHGGHAPTIPGDQAGKPILGHRRTEIVANAVLMLEELGRHHGTDGVAAMILRASGTAPVTVEAGHGVRATGLQLSTQHVAVCHLRSIAYGRYESQRALTWGFVVPESWAGVRYAPNGRSAGSCCAITALPEADSRLPVCLYRYMAGWLESTDYSNYSLLVHRLCANGVEISPEVQTSQVGGLGTAGVTGLPGDGFAIWLDSLQLYLPVPDWTGISGQDAVQPVEGRRPQHNRSHAFAVAFCSFGLGEQAKVFGQVSWSNRALPCPVET